jgi:hypothetical protein
MPTLTKQPPQPIDYATPSLTRLRLPTVGPSHPGRLIACAVLALAGGVMTGAGVVARAMVVSNDGYLPAAATVLTWGEAVVAIGVLAFAAEFIRGWRGERNP